jgi:hypothetical protein
MDVDDVSEVKEYLGVLKKQMETLRAGQKRKGQLPRDRKPRNELVLQSLLAHMHQHIRSGKNPNLQEFQSSFVPPAYPPCIIALGDLTKIMINELRVETHHRDHYILLRSIIPSTRMTAVMSVMEDGQGDAIRLSLYHQGDDRDSAQILPEGAILIVKEPYMKFSADGDYTIRVDHLSDIMHLSSGDTLVPSYWKRITLKEQEIAGDLKAKGNLCFNKANYFAAIG